MHPRALPLSLRVLARHGLFRIWLFGPALRMIGMIEVDRASPGFRPGVIPQEDTTRPFGMIEVFILNGRRWLYSPSH